MTLHHFISAIILSAGYGFIATGILLLFKTAHIGSFAQGEVMMITAFSAVTFYVHWHLPYPLVFVLTIAVGILEGILMEFLLFRPIRRRSGDHGLGALVATLGLAVFLRYLAYLIWGNQPLTLPSPFGREPVSILGVKVTYESIFLIVLMVIALLTLHLFLNLTNLGKAMKATAQNRELANLIGIDTDRTILLTCALAGTLGGVSGLVLGPMMIVNTEIGHVVSLKAFIAAVVGGFGNPLGALVGAFIVGFVEIFGATFISSTYKDIITYAVLIIMLVVKPTGLFGED
jgi:branched-chain amino acid transport system permease protein